VVGSDTGILPQWNSRRRSAARGPSARSRRVEADKQSESRVLLGSFPSSTLSVLCGLGDFELRKAKRGSSVVQIAKYEHV
jgi:hypothetical protein